MKLAEALILRADMQRKLANINSRIAENVSVRENDEPSEMPNKLMKEADEVIEKLYSLIAHIHHTNATVRLANGKTLLMTMIERDKLRERYRMIINALKNAKKPSEVQYNYEVKYKKMVNIIALQRQAEDIAIKIRNLNVLIQATTWKVDLR